MTKSRSALVLLAVVTGPWAAAAAAVEPTAEATLAAYNRQIHEMMDARSTSRRCAPEIGDDAIVVCARTESERYRIPFDPPPGERRRLIAGEPPSARDAMGAGGCLRLCEQPVSVNLVEAVRFLGRGLDRLLHPD